VLIVVAILTVIVVAIGMAFYHLHSRSTGCGPAHLVVGIVTFCALGLASPSSSQCDALGHRHGLYFPCVHLRRLLPARQVRSRPIADWFPIFP